MDTQLALYQAPAVEVLDPEPPVNPNDMMAAFMHALVAAAPPKLTEEEKERAWAEAYDKWLAETPKTGAPRPAATARSYQAAWTDFKIFCPKKYWRVTGLDVREWVDDLRTRVIDPNTEKGLIANGRRQPGQLGLSASTVGQWLAGISSFYSFCQRYSVRCADGRETVLFADLNPAKAYGVQRPPVEPWKDVAYLDPDQLAAFLGAIRSAKTQLELANNPEGVLSAKAQQQLRDHALFYCYIATGARNSEVRTWRWRDISVRGGKRFYSWANKGKHGSDELPADAWACVETYLRAAGRLAALQPDDYIFQPVGDAILHMRRKDSEQPVIDAATWSNNRALSAGEANRLLRTYARRAGIGDVAKLHIHSLRHSKAMLLDACGVNVRTISQELHHSGLDMTGRYLHAVAGQRNTTWAACAAKLNL
jgi:integrase